MRIVSTPVAIAAVAISLAAAPAFAQSTTGAPPPAATRAAPQSTAAISGAEMKDGMRASKVIGSTVVNDQNDTVGKVDDLIFSNKGAQEPMVVLSVGGFLGVGSKLVAIKYNELKAAPDKNEFVLAGATKDSLKSLPDFDYAR